MSATIKASAWYRSRLRLIGWGAALALLALPALAMSAGADGVQWSASDFILFGVMLAMLGGGIELAVSRSAERSHQIGGTVMALTGFLTVWVNLAVGMIGDGANAFNLVFLGIVVAVAVAAVMVGGRPAALAKIALGAAAVQLVTAVAGLGVDRIGGLFSMAFALPWLLAAVLLRSNTQGEAAPL